MWSSINCETIGLNHIKNNIPCQDKTYSLHENDVNVIALADGAGSAPLSHFGAEAVVKSISESLTDNFDFYFDTVDEASAKNGILQSINSVLNDKAKEIGCEIKNLASTLLAVAIKENKCIVIQIGDGIIGYLDNDDLNVFPPPPKGEFFNETFFTTSSVASLYMTMLRGAFNGVSGFILMSDGTADSLYNYQTKKLQNAVKEFMSNLKIFESSFLQQQMQQSLDNLIRKRTRDDCSIALLVEAIEGGFSALSKEEKCSILGFRETTSKNVIRKYEEILLYTKEPKTLEEISRKVHIKIRYLKKKLSYLCSQELIQLNGLHYKSILK